MGTEWIKHRKGRDLSSYHKTRSINWQIASADTPIGESGVPPTITYMVSVQGPPELNTVGGGSSVQAFKGSELRSECYFGNENFCARNLIMRCTDAGRHVI